MHFRPQPKFVRAAVCAAFGLTVLAGCATHPASLPLDVRPVVSINGERSPANFHDPYERGKAYLMAGQFGLAVRAFRTASQNEPNSVRTLNALGVTYDRMRRFDLAERYYMEALALDHESIQTLNNLGYSYTLQGRATLALEYLERSLNLARSNETVLANLAMAQDLARAPGESANADEIVTAVLNKHLRPPKGSIWIERTTARIQTLITRPAPEVPPVPGLSPVGATAPADDVVKALPRIPVEVQDLPATGQSTQRGDAASPAPQSVGELDPEATAEGSTQEEVDEPEDLASQPPFVAGPTEAALAASDAGTEPASDRPSQPILADFEQQEAGIADRPADSSAPEGAAQEPPQPAAHAEAANAETGAVPGGLVRSVAEMFEADRSHLRARAPGPGLQVAALRQMDSTAPAAATGTPAKPTVDVAAAPTPQPSDGMREPAAQETPGERDAAEPVEASAADPGDGAAGGGLVQWVWDRITAVLSGARSEAPDVVSLETDLQVAQAGPEPALIGTAGLDSAAPPPWLRSHGHVDVGTMLASPSSVRERYDRSVEPVHAALQDKANEVSDHADWSVTVALGQPELASVMTELVDDAVQGVTAAGGRAVVEISNGAGRHGMAMRLKAYFQANGIDVERLTNDESFSNPESVIYYRPGFEAEVEFLDDLLPVTVKRQPDDRLDADVRLLLGRDLLSFDRFLTSLLEVDANATAA